MLIHGVNYFPNGHDIWATGVCLVIGGQFMIWNVGFDAGTLSFGIGVSLMGMAYLFLVYSMAEVASMVPFAGGIYGLTRCTLGFYSGFLVGSFGLFQYILFHTCSNIYISTLLIERWPELLDWQPLVWCFTYGMTLIVVCVGGRLFWRFNLAFAVLSLVVIFFYCMGATTLSNISRYSGGSELAVLGGLPRFIQALPHAGWFFTGIEALTTFTNEIDEPKKSIPKRQVASVLTLLSTSIVIYLISISLPPGASSLAYANSAVGGGFAAIFNVTYSEGSLFSIPATLASMPGTAYAGSNVIVALSQSNLLPSWFDHHHKVFQTPVRGILVCFALSWGICFCMMYVKDFALYVYDLRMVFAFTTYIAQCIGYIYLKLLHRNINRLYCSPVGIYGATYSIGIFSVSLMSLLVSQRESLVTLIATMATILILSTYYHLYAKSRQTFSRDEQILFIAHAAKQGYGNLNHRNSVMRASLKSVKSKLQRPRRMYKLHAVVPSISLKQIKSPRRIAVKAKISYTETQSKGHESTKMSS